MCLLVLAIDVRPELPLVVIANRDELLARSAEPLHRWADGIVAGRDRSGGGTWLGLRGKRFAALTNVRDPRDLRPKEPGERSRGAVVTEFLLGSDSARSFAARAVRTENIRGFNLVVGDVGGELVWCSNRGGEPTILSAGIHGVSNALLDTPWPKVERGKAMLATALSSPELPTTDALFAILADRTQPPDADLPDTGVGLELERALGPVQIVMPGYGTRCSTLVLAAPETTTIIERTIAPGPTADVRIEIAT